MSVSPNMRILVIDDMATMRKIIKNMLGQMGLKNIVEADDGSTAWEELEKSIEGNTPFDFVVSDWNMPNMTGLDLVKKIKEDDRFKEIPFLMVTAEAEQGNVLVAVKAGINGFIVKPFSAQTLKEKMAKIFN